MPADDSFTSGPREAVLAVRDEVGKVIVGQQEMIRRLLVGLLVEGHILLEGVPGLAKTKLGNGEVQGIVNSLVATALQEYFEENPAVAKKITEKGVGAARSREAARDLILHPTIRSPGQPEPGRPAS